MPGRTVAETRATAQGEPATGHVVEVGRHLGAEVEHLGLVADYRGLAAMGDVDDSGGASTRDSSLPDGPLSCGAGSRRSVVCDGKGDRFEVVMIVKRLKTASPERNETRRGADSSHAREGEGGGRSAQAEPIEESREEEINDILPIPRQDNNGDRDRASGGSNGETEEDRFNALLAQAEHAAHLAVQERGHPTSGPSDEVKVQVAPVDNQDDDRPPIQRKRFNEKWLHGNKGWYNKWNPQSPYYKNDGKY